MKASCSKSIKSFDIFGHPVQVNFNRQGSNVSSLCGGIISIMVRLCILSYGYGRLSVMFAREDSSIDSYENKVDKAEMGFKNVSDLDILIYFQMQNTAADNYLRPIPVNMTDIRSYIDLFIFNQAE